MSTRTHGRVTRRAQRYGGGDGDEEQQQQPQQQRRIQRARMDALRDARSDMEAVTVTRSSSSSRSSNDEYSAHAGTRYATRAAIWRR
jgi:hypothetical protein